MIETKGFVIIDHGEPNVGIPAAEFDLRGPFIFDENEDYIEFERKLREAMEYCVHNIDCMDIFTYEQIEEMGDNGNT